MSRSQPHPQNAPGDFYVEAGGCIACGAPEREAPELMAHDETGHCFFRRQPATQLELEQAGQAVRVSCCGAVRYGGEDGHVLSRLQGWEAETPYTTKPRRKLLLVALYLVVCLLVDLFPYFGPPAFRYTGSDPAVFVWNFGWPFTTFIYDARSGVHVGPGAYLLVAAQVGLLVLVLACYYAFRRLRQAPVK